MTLARNISKAESFDDLYSVIYRAKPYVTCFGGRYIHVDGLKGSVSLQSVVEKTMSIIAELKGDFLDRERASGKELDKTVTSLLIKTRQMLDEKNIFARTWGTVTFYPYRTAVAYIYEPKADKFWRNLCRPAFEAYPKKRFEMKFGNAPKSHLSHWNNIYGLNLYTKSPSRQWLPDFIYEPFSKTPPRKKSTHLKEIYQTLNMDQLAELTEKATVHLSVLGSRYVTIEGYEGSIHLHDLTSRITSFIHDREFQFSSLERKAGKRIVRNVSLLVNKSCSQMKQANYLTRILATVRSFFEIRRRHVLHHLNDDNSWRNFEDFFETYEEHELLSRYTLKERLNDLERTKCRIGPERYFPPGKSTKTA